MCTNSFHFWFHIHKQNGLLRIFNTPGENVRAVLCESYICECDECSSYRMNKIVNTLKRMGTL